jgi:hypothetical protein
MSYSYHITLHVEVTFVFYLFFLLILSNPVTHSVAMAAAQLLHDASLWTGRFPGAACHTGPPPPPV